MQAPFISLGSEQLSSALLQEVDVVQRLNDHWTCRIVLRDTPDRRPPVEDYAGKELKITTTELDGSEAVVFHGLVRGMRLIYEVTGAWGAELDAVSATWTMAQGTRLKYFRQQSAQATASTVLSNAGLQLGGAMPGGATLSYVQWDETDYHFFARLVDDAEAWFRPAVDGSGGVDVETSFQAGTTVNWREGEYGLLEWTTQGLLQPVTASGANYDPQKMTSSVVTGTGSSVGWYGGAADKMVAAAQAASASVEPAWVDRHRAATLDDLDTRMQREARRGIANTVRCTGISRNPRVRAGDTLAVTGLPGVDATYGVIEVRHAWTTQGYENHFTVTPAQRWSPPVRPARPQLDGVYPARVVDNHDPHNQGRIRVQYYWQEDNQSTWVRLLTPHAGAGRGTLFLPEVGDEVLVTFEEGDAERPYVVGSAWNGVHQPPATGFHSPGETNGSEFEKNYIKRIVTKSGHRITLVDTPGKETISIATPTSNRLMLTESHADTGNRPAIVLESAGDIIMAAPNGRIHTQSMHRSAEVGVGGAAANTPMISVAAANGAAAEAARLATLNAPTVKESSYDGAIIGKGCQAQGAKKKPGETTSKAEIDAAWKNGYTSDSACCQARRAAGQAPSKIVYVNGIKTEKGTPDSKSGQCKTLQAIANQTCASVLGVHNSTSGMVSDLLQSRADRNLIDRAAAGKPVPLNDGRNPAVDTMQQMMVNSVLSKDGTQFYAHSQGGDILALSSYEANTSLLQANVPQGVSGVKAITMASAGQSYAPSLNADHYLNMRDFVPTNLGLGTDPSADVKTTGLNQRVHRFMGDPGAANPQFLSRQQLQEMNQTTVIPTVDGPPVVTNNLPPTSLTKYHDVDTTYLNAVKKDKGGC